MKDNESNVEYSQEYLLETIENLKAGLIDYENLKHKFSLSEAAIMVHREMFQMLNLNLEKVTKERDEARAALARLVKAVSVYRQGNDASLNELDSVYYGREAALEAALAES